MLTRAETIDVDARVAGLRARSPNHLADWVDEEVEFERQVAAALVVQAVR